MKKTAVTGDIATGKSSVCKIFQQLGAYVVDADEIVASLLEENTSVRQKVVELLGSSICDEKNNIQREKIAKKVFQNPKKLEALEQILHPYVFNEIEDHFHRAKKEKKKLFIAEIPLLFEVNAEKDYDYTICVTTDEENQKKRLKETSIIEYEQRKKRQLSSEEKQKKSDFVLNNNGSKEELKYFVEKLYQKMLLE